MTNLMKLAEVVSGMTGEQTKEFDNLLLGRLSVVTPPDVWAVLLADVAASVKARTI